MKIAVGQRWQYVDSTSNFIAEIQQITPSIIVKVVHVYENKTTCDRKIGVLFVPSCLKNDESHGSFKDVSDTWTWTYLLNQDAAKE